jgi:hypothetical protein
VLGRSGDVAAAADDRHLDLYCRDTGFWPDQNVLIRAGKLQLVLAVFRRLHSFIRLSLSFFLFFLLSRQLFLTLIALEL